MGTDAVVGLEGLWRDLRYGVRTLARSPGFSETAVGVMALCLGATTALFGVVRGVLLAPLPFRDPSRLVMVYEHFQGSSVVTSNGISEVIPAQMAGESGSGISVCTVRLRPLYCKLLSVMAGPVPLTRVLSLLSSPPITSPVPE